MRNIILLLLITLISVSCGAKKETANAEKYLLGKWNTNGFSFDFKNDGKMQITDNAQNVDMKYYLTFEKGKDNLFLISPANDTARIIIDSISKNYLRLYPLVNPNDIKIFTK